MNDLKSSIRTGNTSASTAERASLSENILRARVDGLNVPDSSLKVSPRAFSIADKSDGCSEYRLFTLASES